MKIAPDLLQKIKDSVNIVDVIGEHVVLRKSGSNHVGLCPFHSERSPSFSVSESKQLYHCYGCKRGGDLLTFVMEIHGIGFPEAVQELADRARVALPSERAFQDPATQERRKGAQEKLATAFKLNRFVSIFFHQYLKSAPGIARYFARRGSSDELERAFYLGAVSDSWDSLAKHLISAKAPLPLAVELGLIRPSPAGGRKGGCGYFDLFRNRAVFPILDTRGKVAGFGGRVLPSKSDPDGPKYLNSPDSIVFQKSKLIFGLYQAQKHIREADSAVVVEGYFDVLAMHAAGFRNVVATCGTALSSDHVSILSRFATQIIVLFDGDQAGITATERAMEIGLGQGRVLFGATAPKGRDPDEVLFDSEGKPLAGGAEKMREILANAHPLLDARIENEMKAAASGPEARTRALKKVAGWLSAYRDPLGKEVRIQELEKRYLIPRGLVEKALKIQSPAPASRPSQRANVNPPLTTLSGAERVLLEGIVRDENMAEIFIRSGASLPPNTTLADLFESPEARELIQREVLPKGGRLDASQLILGRIADSKLRSLLTEALLAPSSARIDREEFKRALDRSIGRVWARFSQYIKAAMAAAEAKKDAGLQSRLMKEYLDVQRKMKEFISFYDQG